jgi:hypothetical protein
MELRLPAAGKHVEVHAKLQTTVMMPNATFFSPPILHDN